MAETVTPVPGPNTVVLALQDITAVGPPGVQGIQGPQGVAGPVGPPGPPLHAKGTVASSANLPASGNTVSDMWITNDTGHAWAWSGTVWTDLGPFVGPKGATGVQGPQGVQGIAATIVVAGTTTASPGTPASVVNVGTSSAASFQFTIPQGDVGPTGPQGIQGVQGVQGPVGATGPQGPTGPPLNMKGTVATSADLPLTGNTVNDTYVALDTGHGWTWNGTTWIDIGPSMGPAGPVGPQGPQGATGTQGPTGPQGPAGPTVISSDANNYASLGSDNHLYVPSTLASATGRGLLAQLSGGGGDYVGGDNASHSLATAVPPLVWSTRLRSFNAVANPNCEIGQSDVGSIQTNPANSTRGADRWFINKAGMASLGFSIQRIGSGTMGGTSQVLVPGTNFTISNTFLRLTVTTAYASLAAGDLLSWLQYIEGPYFRELQNDVHSCSLLVRSSVAGLAFGLALRDPATSTRSLTKLCTIPSANTWTLISIPNLPVWPNAGQFNSSPGQNGYQLSIVLACGSTFMSPANDTWQNGNFVGAIGQSNLAATLNATFDIAFVQHEPGSQCTTLIDKPFSQNLDECLRYYQKSWDYGTKPGTATFSGGCNLVEASTQASMPVKFPKIMAKDPTITGYSPGTGASGNVRNGSTSADVAISGANNPGDSGFSGFTLTTAQTAPWGCWFHYIADTGW